MSTITTSDYLKNLRAAKELIPDVVIDALLSNEVRITEMNRDQLYDGKTSKDEEIRPFYTEDPFFKTQKQAQGYIAWKQKITPNSDRNPNTPNLFINGYHYRQIGLIKEGNNVFLGIKTGNPLGLKIEQKYKDLYGLAPRNQERVNQMFVYPELLEFLNKYL